MTRKYSYRTEAVGYEVVESHVYDHESLLLYLRLDYVSGKPDFHVIVRSRFITLAQFNYEISNFLNVASRAIAEGGLNNVEKLPFSDVF